jgi:anaerobic magnesium-protoporphyrin IX monomethyl ester cyclase
MRIALLYPPPWKIADPGQAPFPPGEGPPVEYRDGDLDADFFQTPYGLFSLAAQAIRAGHQVKVLNLSAHPWSQVERVVAALDADLFGMSCWTANRRGVGMAAELIRRVHPSAHIVVGGPHATPFARELLRHHPAIDTVSLGESELTFLELIDRLEQGASTTGIAGTAFRVGDQIELGPDRPSIRDLDSLASPHDYFGTHILMTSRGCPWQCTFCGAETTWGRGFRGHSVEYVVDAIESALEKLPVKMIQIKDDTFTANRKRALQICREIRRRGLQFFWSCDTRVDVLSEELLLEMRLAGCQRLSLGVESGSDRILQNIDKKITAQEIIEASSLAKSVGIQVRFYMMLGNRGETEETFRETLAFLDVARPHQYIFSCLSIYPGTLDFQEAVKQGWLDPEVFFTEDFQELKTPFDADEEVTELLNSWFVEHRGVQNAYLEDVPAAQAILDKVGDHHAAHMDLGGAHYRAGNLDQAEHHVLRALELGYPAPGLAYNYLACIAFARGDLQGMQDRFLAAARTDPQHHALIQNVERTRAWFRERGPERGLPLQLSARHEFQLLERTQQPTLPGPLPEDFADWGQVPAAPPERSGRIPSSKEMMLEGHEKQGFPARRLRVVG